MQRVVADKISEARGSCREGARDDAQMSWSGEQHEAEAKPWWLGIHCHRLQ